MTFTHHSLGRVAVVPIQLAVPDTLAAIVSARAAAHHTTPETYVLALIEQAVLEETLRHRHGRRRHTPQETPAEQK
jgi:hypothetical protein